MSWQTVKLGDLFEQYRIEHIVQDDRDYGQITISKNGYIKFRTTKNGKSIGRKRQFIIDLKKYPNTLLFTRQGVAEGAIAFAPKEVDGCIATENMPMFSLKDGIDKKFVELLLKSEQYISEVKKLIPTGSAQKSIHERDLMQITLNIPNEKGQKRLAQIIDSRLNRLEILNYEIVTQQELLKKLRQSILQEAIEGKLTKEWREQNPDIESASVLLEKIKQEKEQLIKEKKIKKQKPLPLISEDEIPFTIPDSWVWCRTDDMCFSISSGSTPSKSAFIDNNGIPYLKVYNIRNQKIDFEYKPQYIKQDINNTKLKRSILYPRDVVMNIVGPPLGKIAIIPENYPQMNCNQAIVHFKLIQPKLHKYLYYFLREFSFLNYIHFKGVAGQDNISVTQSRSILFPLPPLTEQKEIVKKIENLFTICDALEKEVQSSKKSSEQLMQAVLKEAFEK